MNYSPLITIAQIGIIRNAWNVAVRTIFEMTQAIQADSLSLNENVEWNACKNATRVRAYILYVYNCGT